MMTPGAGCRAFLIGRCWALTPRMPVPSENPHLTCGTRGADCRITLVAAKPIRREAHLERRVGQVQIGEDDQPVDESQGGAISPGDGFRFRRVDIEAGEVGQVI